VRRVKHHAIDVQQSVSELVGHVLERESVHALRRDI